MSKVIAVRQDQQDLTALKCISTGHFSLVIGIASGILGQTSFVGVSLYVHSGLEYSQV